MRDRCGERWMLRARPVTRWVRRSSTRQKLFRSSTFSDSVSYSLSRFRQRLRPRTGRHKISLKMLG